MSETQSKSAPITAFKWAPAALTIALLLGLGGCATSNTYQIGGHADAKPLSFQLIDRRDEKQKRAEVMSAIATDCWYGIYRIGDQQLVPDRIQMLAQALQSDFGSRLSGKTITVNRFEIFNNYQSALRGTKNDGEVTITNPAAFGVGGTAGWVVSGTVMSIISANTCEAKLSPEKNPKNRPAIIVNIDITLNGINIAGNVVQLEPAGREATSRGEFTRERLKRAIAATLQKASAEIENVISK